MPLPCIGTYAIRAQNQTKSGTGNPGPLPRRQADGATSESGDTRIVLDVTRVNILFTVTDQEGSLFTDLNKDDFEVSRTRSSR